jgi:hypothetical protein
MSNKYVAMLIPVSKLRRFTYGVGDLGWLNLGYLVRLSGAFRLDKFTLLYVAFQALADHHSKDLPDKSEAFVEYNLGNSELNECNDFNDEFNKIRGDIELLSVPEFYNFVASAGFWLLLASFSVLFFCWWLIFIVPPIIWFISCWAKNMYQLNYMANLAILSHRSAPFGDFCKKNELIADFPDELSSFKIIGKPFGGDEIFRLGSDEWDNQLELAILNEVHDQNLQLNSISTLMSIDALNH